MPRTSAVSLRSSALWFAVSLLWACGPDGSGIRRLPLEPNAAPATLAVSPSGTVLPYIGASARLVASITPDGAAGGFAYSWTSTAPSVASVAADGTVTAITEGEARIVVRILNLVDTATVTVKRLPASVTVAPDSLLFTELGVSQALTPTLVDGGGQALPASEVVWSSSDSTVVTVGSSGSVTSVGQGRTTVKATAGGVVASVRVHVAVGPAEVEVAPRSATLEALGATLQITADVEDAAGASLPGIPVAWLSDDTTVVTVTDSGLLTAVSPGSTSVLVTADTVRATVAVSVIQTPASIIVMPDSVKAVAGASVTYSAVVQDANGHDIWNPEVSWASTDVAVATITSDGTATAIDAGVAGIVGSSGNASDTVRLEVVVPVADSIAVDPDSLTLEESDSGQLTAVLFDAEGDLLVGATPDWSSDDPSVATVDATGRVTGVLAGTVWVRAQKDAGADSVFVTVTPAPGPFNIVVRYVAPAPDAATQAAFDSAEAKWERVIRGDLPSGSVNIAAGACGIGHDAVAETVDDVLIFAEVSAIDGPGGVLGQAGPCVVRTTGGLAIVGSMQFDDADLASLLAQGMLDATIVHEMGHVLGFGVGTPWDDTLVDKGSDDPYWPGTEAVAQYQGNGGTATNAVPVANTGGAGTRDAHWREAHMGRELMTGFINTGQNPLSSISVGAMQDMGYTVDLTAADSYTVSPSLRTESGRSLQLNDAVFRPVFVLDAQGRLHPLGGR